MSRRAVDDDIHRIGVVGDVDQTAGHDRRGRAGAVVDLARLVLIAVGISDLPDDPRSPPPAGGQTVELAVGGDVHVTGHPGGERVLDLAQAAVAEPHRVDGPGLQVDRPDDSVGLGHEPQAPVGVGQGRGDVLAGAQDMAEVVVAHEGKARATLGDHPDVVGGRGRDHAVVAVQEEVATAGEVLERVGGRTLARRQGERGQRSQRVGVEHVQLRSGDTHAHRHDPAAAVKGDRSAVMLQLGRERDRRAPQRPGPGVAVGLPGIVVDLRAPVRGHERVAGRGRDPPDRMSGGGVADECGAEHGC